MGMMVHQVEPPNTLALTDAIRTRARFPLLLGHALLGQTQIMEFCVVQVMTAPVVNLEKT